MAVTQRPHRAWGRTWRGCSARSTRGDRGRWAFDMSCDGIWFSTEKERVFAKFYLMECLDEGAAQEVRIKDWFTFEKAIESLTFAEHREVLRAGERKRLSMQDVRKSVLT